VTATSNACSSKDTSNICTKEDKSVECVGVSVSECVRERESQREWQRLQMHALLRTHPPGLTGGLRPRTPCSLRQPKGHPFPLFAPRDGMHCTARGGCVLMSAHHTLHTLDHSSSTSIPWLKGNWGAWQGGFLAIFAIFAKCFQVDFKRF